MWEVILIHLKDEVLGHSEPKGVAGTTVCYSARCCLDDSKSFTSPVPRSTWQFPCCPTSRGQGTQGWPDSHPITTASGLGWNGTKPGPPTLPPGYSGEEGGPSSWCGSQTGGRHTWCSTCSCCLTDRSKLEAQTTALFFQQLWVSQGAEAALCLHRDAQCLCWGETGPMQPSSRGQEPSAVAHI